MEGEGERVTSSLPVGVVDQTPRLRSHLRSGIDERVAVRQVPSTESLSTDRLTFFNAAERIKLRMHGPNARRFDMELRRRVAERLDASDRRIFGLVVFVDENGAERKLIE